MSDRKKTIERLRAVELREGMSSHEMLSAIGRAIFPEMKAWTRFACTLLREDLVFLLEDADAEIDAVRHECNERIAQVVEESMQLPRDMDGNVIHVGDEMEFIDGEPFDVIGIGEHTLYYYDEEDEAVHWTRSSSKRHYHREDER